MRKAGSFCSLVALLTIAARSALAQHQSAGAQSLARPVPSKPALDNAI
jgi:hypothetical protein